jgi:hypothetical protein
VLIVAGLSLKNLEPRVWDPASPYHLPALRAVMVSYADFHRNPARHRAATHLGLRSYLGLPASLNVYLDNGAFAIFRRGGETSADDYRTFVAQAKPDWYPIPRDVIPGPQMSVDEQRVCLRETMAISVRYSDDGFAPVIHVSRVLAEYIALVRSNEQLHGKPRLAIGGIVPHLLRAPKARPYGDVLADLIAARRAFAEKEIHLFGVGGTATLHLAALLGMDSVDSSGWRNRAARGIVQLPGGGDRMVANLGSWRGREPSPAEWRRLHDCPCPACRLDGPSGLQARGLAGFRSRATHNLWTLLDEARLIDEHLRAGTYRDWYRDHLDNTIYRPLIDRLLAQLGRRDGDDTADPAHTRSRNV